MKLSKTLLNTIMLAVTVGTVSSCTKTIEKKWTNLKSEIKGKQNQTPTPEPCPACGMG